MMKYLPLLAPLVAAICTFSANAQDPLKPAAEAEKPAAEAAKPETAPERMPGQPPDPKILEGLFACIAEGLPEKWEKAWIVIRETKRSAELEAAKQAERKRKAKEEATRARLEEQAYSARLNHRRLIIQEAQSNIEQLFADLSTTDLKGTVEPSDGTPLDIKACPTTFLREIAPVVNEERKRLFQLYCVERREQRIRESLTYGYHERLIAKACGKEYQQALIPPYHREETSRVNAERASNPEIWECRVLRDYAIVGDKPSKVYWGKEFESKCVSVKDKLD